MSRAIIPKKDLVLTGLLEREEETRFDALQFRKCTWLRQFEDANADTDALMKKVSRKHTEAFFTELLISAWGCLCT